MPSSSPGSRSNESERFKRYLDEHLPSFLSDPWNLPDEMKSYLLNYTATNIPQIPFSQIVGFPQFRGKIDEVATAEATTSTSFTDLTTEGPELAGLSNGQYIVQFGAGVSVAAAGTFYVSLSVNGSTPTTGDAAFFVSAGGSSGASIMRSLAVTLDGGNSNSIKLQYRTTGVSGTFDRRWLTVFRSGN